ncbi:hypothetical protein BBJ28_00014356 [Nothophytophthora sp. Chile5]|nr:hypothetical protein BBJ28_00014356 [Nothophytophthora sp. Chile5]
MATPARRPGGGEKRPRRFSLRGSAFHFHGVSPAVRSELTALLVACEGEVYRPEAVDAAANVFVLTDYWTDWALPPATRPLIPATPFWLREMLRLQRWLRPDAHAFFQLPPASEQRIQFPMTFQDYEADERDADGDVSMATAPAKRWRLRLPWSSRFRFYQEVPFWPYFAAYLSQPMRDVHELTRVLNLYVPFDTAQLYVCRYGASMITLTDPRRRLNCLEYAVIEVTRRLMDLTRQWLLLTPEEQTAFFRDVLPEMARLVLAMPLMFAAAPWLLTPLEGDNVVVESAASGDEQQTSAAAAAGSTTGKTRVETQRCRFTKLETLALVCGCFFGIFPEQDIVKSAPSELNPQRKTGRRGNTDDVVQFPFFTAVRMLSAPAGTGRLVVLKGQKLRCLLQYFLRVVPRAIADPAALSAEVIDFTRVGVHVPHAPDAKTEPQELLQLLAMAPDPVETAAGETQGETPTPPSMPLMCPARCVSDALIEELDQHLQIDFANKFAGGGVLNAGCVQEEIRFLLSPELLVACLVFAKLEPHEAFVIHGTERYCGYEGYGGSFAFAGDFEDTTRLARLSDGALRRECVIVGIDATDYGSARVERQYSRGHVWRDLLKAYAGFAYPEAEAGGRCWPVATGNWGCGVFQGDRELKFLIQWLAASLRRREMVYVLFERDLDLQTKVDPLLALATSAKAREWDEQSAGLSRWLVRFLFGELSGMRGGESVLTRAFRSLERALAAHCQQQKGEAQQEAKPQAESVGEPQQASPSPKSPSRMEPPPPPSPPGLDESVATRVGLEKKPKELQQKTMQDYFASK